VGAELEMAVLQRAARVYFRMMLLGYFEGIESDRGIAWRCSDSSSVRSFLGLPLTAKTPDHSNLSRIRQRLTPEVHGAVFKFVLQVLADHDLLDADSVAVDGTTLEANAALKSIIRHKGGDSYKEYLKTFAKKMGIEEPTQEDLSKLDPQTQEEGFIRALP
jgi:transposase